MKDKVLNEINEGLLEQFRVIRNRDGVMEDELRIADSMANVAGKVLKAYAIELAYEVANVSLPQATERISATRHAISDAS